MVRLLAMLLVGGTAVLLAALAPALGDGALAQEFPAHAPPAPGLISPADGLVTSQENHPPTGVPTLRWQAVPGASKYRIQVSKSLGFAEYEVNETTEATSYTPKIALADGQFYWRVQAEKNRVSGPFSTPRSFTKDWSAGGANIPRLESPVEGAVIRNYGQNGFTWQPVSGAATYRLDISTSPGEGFDGSIIYTNTTIKAQHTPLENLASSPYFWRVTPIDRRDHAGRPSEIRSFTLSWDQPPALLEPEDQVTTQFLPTFRWTAVEGARYYEIQISTDPDFSSAQVAEQTDATEYTPERALSNDQDYYWRIKAVNYSKYSSPWSETRQFRIRWGIWKGSGEQLQVNGPTLLTPLNNSSRRAYPFFSWTPVAGAERYQIQIATNLSFDRPLADIKLHNTSYAQPEWDPVYMDGDYYWRVRAMDAQDNYSPWSSTFAFSLALETTPNLIYPHYYHTPDSTAMPVHSDRTVAWPFFVWDTAHRFDALTGMTDPPDYYRLEVTSDPTFASVNFTIETAGLAAAPTTDHPFQNLADGHLYYWRVRAFRGGVQMGGETRWITRMDRSTPELPFTTAISPIYPAAAFEAVGTPPPLGWQPVTGAHHYRVQIAQDRNFTMVVDEAQALFVNYVPWQGRHTTMPFGAYWWRVRAEDSDDKAITDWSEARHFNLSQDLVNGNPFDLVPDSTTILTATDKYDPELTWVAESTQKDESDYALGDLHIMLDRTYNTTRNNWIIAFQVTPTVQSTLQYGIYIDMDHVAGSGGATDPRGKPIQPDPLFLPEYVLYITRTTTGIDPADVTFCDMDSGFWQCQALGNINGAAWLEPTTSAVQVLIPYTALSSAHDQSAAVTIFSTGVDAADGMRNTIPPQGNRSTDPAVNLDNPAFVSDMLMPLYPFDTPLWNPRIYNDMPALRWRMPYFDSVDGYQVQVARDAEFTDEVSLWDTYEVRQSSYFALMPTAFRSEDAFEDNESYYWRVRIRHEVHDDKKKSYDFGPWSPPMRFKLSSRLPGNPELTLGELSAAMPSFRWERTEGAAGYKIEIDDDINFSSTEYAEKVDGTGFTPPDALPDGTHYWRVAIRRSDKVIGQWTPIMSFEKRSLAPQPASPVDGVVINEQPTFQWTAILTPTEQPRIAAPRYELQVDSDPNFSKPKIFQTHSPSYTPTAGNSLADGTWYWRVAAFDGQNRKGSFSETQSFYKEYLPPVLMSPTQGETVQSVPNFTWAPMDGAAYYKIEIDESEFFSAPEWAETDNTSYTHNERMDASELFWRVQMFDDKRNPGPFITGRVKLQEPPLFLPVTMR